MIEEINGIQWISIRGIKMEMKGWVDGNELTWI